MAWESICHLWNCGLQKAIKNLTPFLLLRNQLSHICSQNKMMGCTMFLFAPTKTKHPIVWGSFHPNWFLLYYFGIFSTIFGLKLSKSMGLNNNSPCIHLRNERVVVATMNSQWVNLHKLQHVYRRMIHDSHVRWKYWEPIFVLRMSIYVGVGTLTWWPLHFKLNHPHQPPPQVVSTPIWWAFSCLFHQFNAKLCVTKMSKSCLKH